MKRKTLLFILSAILTIIVFVVSTNIQKSLVNYEPKVTCLFVKEDIKSNEKLTQEKFERKEVNVSFVATTRIIDDFSEIDGLYSKCDLYKGQIALGACFDTKENLAVYEVDDGKEKISLKIKSAENGVSYAIRNNSLVNVYATIRSDMAKGFLDDHEKLFIGDDDGYVVIKLLENVKVVECFDIDGIRMQDSDTSVIDTIIVGVTKDEAKQINLLRDIANFNITGVNGFDDENIEIESGDVII